MSADTSTEAVERAMRAFRTLMDDAVTEFRALVAERDALATCCKEMEKVLRECVPLAEADVRASHALDPIFTGNTLPNGEPEFVEHRKVTKADVFLRRLQEAIAARSEAKP